MYMLLPRGFSEMVGMQIMLLIRQHLISWSLLLTEIVMAYTIYRPVTSNGCTPQASGFRVRCTREPSSANLESRSPHQEQVVTLGIISKTQIQELRGPETSCKYKSGTSILPPTPLASASSVLFSHPTGTCLQIFTVIMPAVLSLPTEMSIPTALSTFCVPFAENAFPNEIFFRIVDSAENSQLDSISQIRIVAGARCIRWRQTLQNDRLTYIGTIVPDSFKEALVDLARADPDLLRRVKELTLSGLSTEERFMSNNMGGSGDDPYLTTCIIRQILQLLPSLKSLHIANVLWSPCLNRTLSPSHCCHATTFSPDLSIMRFTGVTHGRVTESVFDIMHLVKSCETMYISAVQWDYILPTGLRLQRLERPDVHRLCFDFPTGFDIGDQVLRRFPVFKKLTYLEVHDITDMTYDALVELVNFNCVTLRKLVLDVGRNAFPVEQWVNLPLNKCKNLEEVRLILDLCAHEAHETCAGLETLTWFTGCLPCTLRKIHIHTEEVSDFPHSVRRLCTIPDWVSIIPNLRRIRSLKTLEFTVGDAEVESDASVLIEWEDWIHEELRDINIIFSDADEVDMEPVEFHRL
ncbi:hypothetical protein NM688_g6369 [Phlebia brevispora]|uniref:Uncharacterized protein n=1 Tax=Phlebia brevispora TaxID=194682 RepID=A0ACC1SGT3_9APHY|nr:hypothetical protein NM688_g6369 [Phlebia brevispora]